MTLNTMMYVHDEVNAYHVFDKARSVLGADGSHPIMEKEGVIYHPPGLGLDAWLHLYHGEGQILHGKTLEEGLGEETWLEPVWLEVSFDTAYGYSDDLGRGCGDLHVSYLAVMGLWLDGHGKRWSWQNEFTGEIWGPGVDRYDRLEDLGSLDQQVVTDVVLPGLGLPVA